MAKLTSYRSRFDVLTILLVTGLLSYFPTTSYAQLDNEDAVLGE